MANVFERTALFQKTSKTNGTESIKRIPWDLICMEGCGFMVSPMPMQALLADVTVASVAINPSANDIDMLADVNLDDSVDNVIDFEFFQSEQDFISKFENTFGFYSTDNQSGEFGYPMDSGV